MPPQKLRHTDFVSKPEKQKPREVVRREPPKTSQDELKPIYNEYKALPTRRIIQSPKRQESGEPEELGKAGIFFDHEAARKQRNSYRGSPVLSVPIAKKEKPKEDSRPSHSNITSVLFEESVMVAERIDPWGFAEGEDPDIGESNIRGLKVKVSRL